jgi:hypothetical protein
LSWRRLAVLLRHLPREAATVQAQHGDKVAWGTTEYLLAAAVDALNVANWQRQRKKGAKRPKPITRPGDGPKKYGTKHSIPEMRRILDEWGRR